MADLCDYEVLVLRACAGEDPPGLQWGAAMSVALESLQSRGYVKGQRAVATDAGRKYLLWLAEEAARG